MARSQGSGSGLARWRMWMVVSGGGKVVEGVGVRRGGRETIERNWKTQLRRGGTNQVRRVFMLEVGEYLLGDLLFIEFRKQTDLFTFHF